MSDTAVTKTPTMASFLPMAATGMASASIGDKLGDAFSQLIAWKIAIDCNCVPPDKVISALHTICEALVVGGAFLLHYIVIKRLAKEN